MRLAGDKRGHGVPFVRVCPKCEACIPDSEAAFLPCACGTNDWAIVEVPVKSYRLTVLDKTFLKSLHIIAEGFND